MTRKPELDDEVVGEVSSRPGVALFLLPMAFNDLRPGMGMMEEPERGRERLEGLSAGVLNIRW
jgi:hypothetical protein